MSKLKKQLLAGPYLIWIIGFIILPLFMIVYYAFKSSDGGFTTPISRHCFYPYGLESYAP